MRTASLATLRGVLVAAPLLLSLAVSPAAADRPGYPRVLNMCLGGYTWADVDELARYDVLVTWAGVEEELPGFLSQLRALNPNITLLAYIPINGVNESSNRPPESLDYQYWAGCQTYDYWLYSVDGTNASDWPDKVTTNLTQNCPVNPMGENFGQWFARFIWEKVWKNGNSQWDGICLDDVWNEIYWLDNLLPSPVDSDRDGIPDEHDALNTWWREGNAACVNAIRGYLGPNAIIIGNGGNTVYGDLNGAYLENFPYNSSIIDQGNPYGYTWQQKMFTGQYSYFVDLANYNANPRSITAVHTYWSQGDRYTPDRTGRFEAHKRLCLGSALLGDGYFTMDFSYGHHDSFWWEPEFDMHIGDPLGPAYNYTLSGVTIWRRDYTLASVVVNPNNASVGPEAGVPLIDGWDAYIGPPIVDPPPPDTIPPAATSAYWGYALDTNSVLLKWTASGDDGNSGQAAHYRIRYSLTAAPVTDPAWDAATVVPNNLVPLWPGNWDSLVVSGFNPGTTIWFVVRSEDDAGNLAPTSGKSYRVSTFPVDPPGGDITLPNAIGSLTLGTKTSTGATFGFYAPGDDGIVGQCASYAGRYASAPITSANWNSATPFTQGLPVPQQYGMWETCSVSGLTPHTTYYLTVRGVDNAGNMGPVGNNISFTTLYDTDQTPPSTVTDLAAVPVDATTLELGFTAPSDASPIPFYELRYRAGTTSFADSDWAGAVSVSAGTPSTPGTHHVVLVPGLVTGQTYAFRFRSRDINNNQSALSNVAVGVPAQVSTPSDTTGPAKVSDLHAITVAATSATLGFTAPADSAGSVASYDLRYVVGTTFPGSAWAGATPVSMPSPSAPGTPVSVGATGLAGSTSYCFGLVSTDNSGNPSAISNILKFTTPAPPDTTGPATVSNLAASSVGQTFVQLGFTAPADGQGTVTAYEVRYVTGGTFSGAQWSGATPVTPPTPGAPGSAQSVTASGLTAGTGYAFRMRSQDNSGNWSALSNTATGTTTTPPDTTGPATVSNLVASAIGQTFVQLGFTAPPDGQGTVTAYEVRYVSGSTFSGAMWSGATPVTPPAPGAPGTAQTATASGLTAATAYAFRMRSQDNSGNWSTLSNTATATTQSAPPPPPADSTGPASIDDLAVVGSTSSSLTLQFTAPADGEGSVAAYAVRYMAGSAFPASKWGTAITASAPPPATPGSQVSFAVGGLAAQSTYSFRMEAQDDSGNWSAVGNRATGTTASSPPPPPPADTTGPAAVANLTVIDAGETWLTVTFTAPADAQGTVTAYDLRYLAGSTFPSGSWSGATQVPLSPASPGSSVQVTVSGLASGTPFAFRMRSQDNSGNWSALSNTATDSTLVPPPPPDTMPPGPVTDLVVEVQGEGQVRLTWTTVGDDGNLGQASEYRIRWRLDALGASTWASATPVAGTPVPAPAGQSQSLSVVGLPVPAQVAFGMLVFDEAGNSSPLSNVAVVELDVIPPPDTTPPLPVSGFGGLVVGSSVRLTWSPSPEGDLKYYRIYRARAESPGFTLYRDGVVTPVFVDHQVAPGREYGYRVTALDHSGNESGASTTVSVRVPNIENVMLPLDFFSADFPAPNPSTGPVSLPLTVGSDAPVSVFVFDVGGKLVRGFQDRLPAGQAVIRWDGRDESGRLVARGVYFLHVQTPLGSQVRRILIAR